MNENGDTQPGAPAGWYPDPTNPNVWRYWDGSSWHAPLPAQPQTAPSFSPPPSGGDSAVKWVLIVVAGTLAVVFMIGVLAAIAVPSFLSQRAKGQDACAKSQARSMSTAMESFYTRHNTYSASLDDLQEVERSVAREGGCGPGTAATVATRVHDDGRCGREGHGSKTSYCVAHSSESGAWFVINQDYGADGTGRSRWCGPEMRLGSGGCPASGSW